MSTPPLLEIPEILLVSKLWYQTLRPLAWQEVHLGRFASRQPFLKTVLKHKDYIKSLHISSNSFQDSSLSPQTWKTVLQLDKIQSLIIEKVSFEEEYSIYCLWDLCERVERLEWSLVFIAAKSDLESRSFSHIRELHLNGDFTGFDEVHVMSQCPNLQSLVWPSGLYWGKPIDRFVQLAAKGTWPALESITKANYQTSDDQQALVLGSMRRVTGWSARVFGPKSFQVLRNHWATLKTLELSMCRSSATTAMLQEILTSCPLLEQLQWGLAHAADLVSDQPWACTRLRTLKMSVRFRHDENDSLQPLLFERLSELTALEMLDLGKPPIASNWEDADDEGNNNDDTAGTLANGIIPFKQSVDLRVGRGLEKLATMRSMRVLFFQDTTQQMSRIDVAWMLTHWPKLRAVNGKLNLDDDILYDLSMLLAGAEVCYYK
ncbi:hypothetical protein BGZ98_007323 [Dissophora globulifera]|nr:hypothetical protein BGZ98_007323 [Dissophora globulifera]